MNVQAAALKPENRYQSFLREYTTTGPGTQGGEMLRRYWHPLCLSSDLIDVPYPVRMLGEDLVAFRTPAGVAGLVDAKCPHRGASLAYGQLRDEGIQCSYHGWTFDGRGRCQLMPLEPSDSKLKNVIRQKAYVVEEWGGIVWCYMGPDQDAPPPLPKIDVLARTDGQVIVQRGIFYTDESGKVVKTADADVRNYNYLSFLENIVDMGHIYALHMIVTPELSDDLRPHCDLSVDTTWQNITHKVFETDYGLKAVVVHNTSEPTKKFVNTFSVALPTTYRFSGLGARESDFCADRRESGGVLRVIDDEHFEIIRIQLLREGNYKNQNAIVQNRNGSEANPTIMRGRYEAKAYDVRQYPAWEGNVVLEDLVMQESQGAIPDRSLEHLTPCDMGVALMRRIWGKAMDAVAEGKTPKSLVTDNQGVLWIDTFKGFIDEAMLELGPRNLETSEEGRGLIRNESGELVF